MALSGRNLLTALACMWEDEAMTMTKREWTLLINAAGWLLVLAVTLAIVTALYG